MIVFNDTLGAYGGSHTLMLRMCQWLSEHQVKATMLCTSDANEEISGKIRALGIPVLCVDLKDLKATEKVFKSLLAVEAVTVVNFMWPYYLDLEFLKYKTGLRFTNVIYGIHPDTFKKGIRFQNTFLYKYIAGSYGKLLERMNENNAIYSMDEDILAATRNSMQVRLNPSPTILPLPMFCKEKSGMDEIIQNGFNSPIIMTAARADFPYKGYLLGLVNDFKFLKDKYPSLKLEIVTGGMEEDVAKLRGKIMELPAQYQNDVIFHDWMDYSVLKKMMEHCKVFIGMGTSVLDAALAFKPAIPVKYNTFENLADSFLSDCPECIAADPGCQKQAACLLDEVLQMNQEQYCEACLLSFQSVKEYYDIDITMNRILNIEVHNKDCILTKWEAIRHSLNNWINQILHRTKDRFEVQRIKVEK